MNDENRKEARVVSGRGGKETWGAEVADVDQAERTIRHDGTGRRSNESNRCKGRSFVKAQKRQATEKP